MLCNRAHRYLETSSACVAGRRFVPSSSDLTQALLLISECKQDREGKYASRRVPLALARIAAARDCNGAVLRIHTAVGCILYEWQLLIHQELAERCCSSFRSARCISARYQDPRRR